MSYTVTESAKILRQVLKESFPGVKFSVRSETFAEALAHVCHSHADPILPRENRKRTGPRL